MAHAAAITPLIVAAAAGEEMVRLLLAIATGASIPISPP